MPVLKRRTRTVIFRLTEDEYDQLKTALVTHGARNVSDFARTELLKSVAGERQEMTQKLAQIESSVNRLEQLMTGIVTRDTSTQN
jgi:hypothetical protein